MFRIFKSNSTAQRGVTIVELLVIITVAGILSTIVFTTLDDLYQSNVRAIAETTQAADTRSALHTIEDSLTLASGVLASYTPPAAPFGPDDSDQPWSFTYPGTPGFQTLLVRSAASTKNPDGSRAVVVNSDSTACPAAGSSSIVFNTTIFFVKNGTLYRRTQTPKPCTLASAQKQTCATTATVRTDCQSNDARLLDNVTKLQFDYYTQASDTIPMNISDTATDISTAQAVDVTIETTRRINGQKHASSASTRVVVDNRKVATP